MQRRRTGARGFPRRGHLLGDTFLPALWAPCLVVLGLGLAIPARGTGDLTPPRETADAPLIGESTSWDRHLQRALGLPSWLDLAVEHRTRFEFLEDPFRPGEPDTQSQFPQRTRLRVGADGPGPLRFLAEFQDARTHGDGPRDFTGLETDRLDVLQLFFAATTRDLLGSGLRADVHLGRLTLDFGSRRLVARNRFRNITNSFDGIHLQLGHGESWRLRGFFSRPVVPLEPGYFDDDSSWKQLFWGVAYQDQRVGWLNLEAYYFGLDERTVDLEYQTLGLRGSRPAGPEQVDFDFELIGQLGDSNGRDHSAVAVHAELGYTLGLPWSPRLAAEFDYASGTSDPSGDETHTFFFLFGARRFDLNPTGIYGPFRRSNILSPGVRLLVSPLPNLKGQFKFRYWELAAKRDRFVGTGLQDQTGAAGRHLGEDIELSLQWRPMSWLAMEMGYGHWFKGSYLDRVAGVSSTADSDYAYAVTRLRF